MDVTLRIPTLKPEPVHHVQYDIADTNLCPICSVPMQAVTAARVPAWVCLSDRVVLPKKTTDGSGK